MRSTEDEDSPKGYRSSKPATPSGEAGRKALFAGTGDQLGVFRQTEKTMDFLFYVFHTFFVFRNMSLRTG